jgi:hypothetical protein
MADGTNWSENGCGMWFMWIIVIFALMGGGNFGWGNRGNALTQAEMQYPFRQKGGNNVYANQLKQRGSYIIRVAADTKQFVLIHGWLNALNIGNVATLP